MVYMSSNGLDWEPILESWIKKKEMMEEVSKNLFCFNFDSQDGAAIRGLFHTHFPNVYKWAEANLTFVMKVLQVSCVNLFFLA